MDRRDAANDVIRSREAQMATIRRGATGDAQALKALDTIVPMDARRAESIDEWLRRDVVFVAEVGGRPVGYGVFNHDFFDQGNVAMLMLHPDFRGQHIGEKLLRALEEVCDTPKFFCTTNLSNQRTQRLLTRREFSICGFVSELDPGDPELIFVKKLSLIGE